jgi:hypothetical protein
MFERMFASFESSDRGCSFEGCGRPFRARGLCSSHLDQLARGKPLTPIRVWKTTCEFPGCDNKHAGNGLCRSHMSQLQRGRPLQPIGAGFRFGWDDPKGYPHQGARWTSQRAKERIHLRACPGDESGAWPSSPPSRAGPPQERREERQPAGEPGAVGRTPAQRPARRGPRQLGQGDPRLLR